MHRYHLVSISKGKFSQVIVTQFPIPDATSENFDANSNVDTLAFYVLIKSGSPLGN